MHKLKIPKARPGLGILKKDFAVPANFLGSLSSRVTNAKSLSGGSPQDMQIVPWRYTVSEPDTPIT